MKRLSAFALTGVALCHVAPALAQQSPQIELPTLTIIGAGEPAGGSLTVPSVAQQREELNKTAASVGFIDAESFKSKYATNLVDVLQESPGVFAQSRYSQEVRLSIRGSGISRSFHTRGIEILQDGIPTNLADGSGDYYQIDPLGLRSVEVFKGGNALAFGTSTLGGAVNFVTPTAHTAIAPNVVRIDAGSFGTLRTNVQVSRVMGDWDFLINGTYTRADGWRQHEQQDLKHLNANVGYRINPSLETRFYFGAYYTDQQLPGTLNYADAMNNPRKAAAAALAGRQARDTHVERVANRTTLLLGNGRIDLDSWLIHKNLFHPIFQVIDQDGTTFGIAPRYTGQFDLGGYRNEIVAGARFVKGTNEARQYLNVAGSRGAQTLNSRQSSTNAEVFAENRFYVIPQLALVAGAKAYRQERDYLDRGGLAAPGNLVGRADSKSYSGFSPKVGLLFEPAKDIQAFANVTRSADVPDFTDLNQTIATTNTFVPLKQQRATTLEIGTRGKWDRLTWDVTLYRSDLRDEMLQFTTNPLIPAATFNAPRTLHQGVELGASFDLVQDVTGAGDRISLRQVWTHNDFRFRDNAQYGNNILPTIPRNVLRTALSYTHPSGFYLTPTLDWVPGGAFVDYANTFKTPGYTLLGLQTGINLKNGLSLYVDARNLTDRRYISDFAAVQTYVPATYASFYPGTGRSIFAGARYAF